MNYTVASLQRIRADLANRTGTIRDALAQQSALDALQAYENTLMPPPKQTPLFAIKWTRADKWIRFGCIMMVAFGLSLLYGFAPFAFYIGVVNFMVASAVIDTVVHSQTLLDDTPEK